jgi:6-phosphofructokinase 1
VLDLGDDRFWLLPRDLADRTLLFTMRHGISRVESKTHRVGQRLSNQLDEERGVPSRCRGSALARMVGSLDNSSTFCI